MPIPPCLPGRRPGTRTAVSCCASRTSIPAGAGKNSSARSSRTSPGSGSTGKNRSGVSRAISTIIAQRSPGSRQRVSSIPAFAPGRRSRRRSHGRAARPRDRTGRSIPVRAGRSRRRSAGSGSPAARAMRSGSTSRRRRHGRGGSPGTTGTPARSRRRRKSTATSSWRGRTFPPAIIWRSPSTTPSRA